MMPTWVYAKSADGVYVNLFVGSTITVENVGGTDIEMVQATEYPWNGKVSITVNPKVARNFSVRIRVPDRGVSRLYNATPDANGVTSIAVNGSAVKPAIDKGYAVITRDVEGRRQDRRGSSDEGAAHPRQRQDCSGSR